MKYQFNCPECGELEVDMLSDIFIRPIRGIKFIDAKIILKYTDREDE